MSDSEWNGGSVLALYSVLDYNTQNGFLCLRWNGSF
jgi:hypothetical protein